MKLALVSKKISSSADIAFTLNLAFLVHVNSPSYFQRKILVDASDFLDVHNFDASASLEYR